MSERFKTFDNQIYDTMNDNYLNIEDAVEWLNLLNKELTESDEIYKLSIENRKLKCDKKFLEIRLASAYNTNNTLKRENKDLKERIKKLETNFAYAIAREYRG